MNNRHGRGEELKKVAASSYFLNFYPKVMSYLPSANLKSNLFILICGFISKEARDMFVFY
jgi:hypothetical protein